MLKDLGWEIHLEHEGVLALAQPVLNLAGQGGAVLLSPQVHKSQLPAVLAGDLVVVEEPLEGHVGGGGLTVEAALSPLLQSDC